MRTTTLLTGALLFLVGPLGFVMNKMQFKPGQAIAATFGMALLACGLASTSTKSTKIAMHIAVVVALLGFLGSMFGKGGLAFAGWIALLGGRSAEPGVALSQLLVFLLCGFFVVRSVLWFLGNRAARRAA